MKLIGRKQSFFLENGKIVEYTQVYLVLENGFEIAIKATYKNCKQLLLSLCESVKE